ncbi:mechanosensitive ion channel family protein [Chitinophaga qingshengii]|uniref:Mechanosensitive ion channel family protein n=1 Tax=Chitinophaga qingshengii TaxID=1569794 RepID=A0ABR7TNT2_9BACT|nr:mechanosensitive ion channel family protein [Chitinophaga qingshengii]MBC9931650.1 mechanosensitive ion channel family protein [Chitinophaga qingshengii]
MRSLLSILLTILTFHVQSHAQDSSKVSQDSTTNAQLIATTRLLRESDSLIKADAAAKAALEEQILQLSNSNNQRKKELEQKLADIIQTDSLKKARQLERINQMKAISQGIPIAPFGDTLFRVYYKLGPFKPIERAASITKKLQLIEKDPFFSPDSIRVTPNENTVDIVYNDLIVQTITDDDALWLNQDKAQVANDYAAIIRKAIQQQKAQHSMQYILVRLGWLALILAVLSIIIFGINRLFKSLRKRLIREKDRYLKGVKVKNYALLNQQKQLGIIYSTLGVARIVLILLVLYLTLPLVFGIFPWTKGIADKLIEWTLSPVKAILTGIFSYLPKLLTIIVIYVVTRLLVRLVNYLASEIASGNLKINGFYTDWALPTASGIKFLLYAFMFVVIFPYLPGSDSKIFQGVSVFLGILFSLGSSSAISNVVAGFVITYMRPFKIGDRIRLGEITGDVIEKNLLVTRLRTVKNEEITVPNASILNGHTVNFTSSSKDLGLILHTTVTIGYDVPWRQVHELLIRAALATDGLQKDRKPFVLQKALNDFSVAYEINAYTESSHQMGEIYSRLNQHIQDIFNEAGVEIMSPQYHAHRDGNGTTTPRSYMPDNYEPPAFKIKVDHKP